MKAPAPYKALQGLEGLIRNFWKVMKEVIRGPRTLEPNSLGSEGPRGNLGYFCPTTKGGSLHLGAES